MGAKPYVAAVIPARGGSTRLPGKNVALLGGRPLIAHTISAALGARSVDEVFVSTDHQEIANVSRRWGAQVIQRPAELATAQSPTEPCLIHAVRAIEARRGHPVDVLVLLQPTSPLRGAGRIDQAVRLLVESGCDSVASVVKDIHYYFLGELGPQSELKVGYDPNNRLRTQDIPPRYRENGAIYVMTREQLMDRGCRMGGDLRALVMDETESVDIDTMLDLQHCELLLPRTSAGELVRPATVETPALTAA
ncbi:MAG: acylneuraminate cytidylyltransferase family protein [Deltaproteobacteria bacterium]|nr:acylneuraminate cytidylyltransferase family protein [Deltaproteobacteria bacterium]